MGGDTACYCNFVETLDQHIKMGLTHWHVT